MKLPKTPQIFSLLAICVSLLAFQNCGEEGFISQNGVESFSSFETVYPSMGSDGDIRAKYEEPDQNYKRAHEYIRNNNRIYRAVGSVPSTAFPSLVPTTGGTSTGGTSTGGTTLTGGGEVPVLETPGFAGQVDGYYSGVFRYLKSIGPALEKNEKHIYPERYYGRPTREGGFEDGGLGIIRVDLKLGMRDRVQVDAEFYQYKEDYFRKKAVIFVIGDGLFDDPVGAQVLSINQTNLVRLAKKGYLVVRLKPKALYNYVGSKSKSRCENIEEAIYRGVQEIRSAVGGAVKKADYYGLNPEKMFIVGFGEGGTLAAYTAFLDTQEAVDKFGRGLFSIKGFEDKSLFKGVGISGGGILDRSIMNGASKARVVTIHGGCDDSVKVDGSEMYGCMKKDGAQINPISSKKLTDFAAGYMGSSASVLNCSKGEDTSEVTPINTQFGYFATYFHNIMGDTNKTIFGNLGGGMSVYYQRKYCTSGGRDDDSSCSFPAPLINNVIYGTCKKGPCSPPQSSQSDGGR